MEQAIKDGSTEYYISGECIDKIWVELAWRAIAGRWIRRDLEPDTEDLFSRAVTVEGSHVKVLAPEDNLLQVCIHTAKHSYVRAPGLRLHLDVERIVAYKKIDWEAFMCKVDEVHVKTAVYYSLLIPKILFHTAVPDEVLKKLEPVEWKKRIIQKYIVKSGLMHPECEKFSRFEFLLFQTSLYDSMGDVIKVLNPGKKWMMERYEFKHSIFMPYYVFLRGLDLAGIRKRK